MSRPAQYSDPTNTVQVDLGLIGFVDDCSGQTNAFHDAFSPQTLDILLTKSTLQRMHKLGPIYFRQAAERSNFKSVRVMLSNGSLLPMELQY